MSPLYSNISVLVPFIINCIYKLPFLRTSSGDLQTGLLQCALQEQYSETSVGQNVVMETINVFPPRVVLGAIQGSGSHIWGMGYIKGLSLLMVSTDPIQFSRMDIH